MRWCVIAFILSGCAAAKVVTREPAGGMQQLALSPGGMNEDEERDCDGYRCKHFIAPCSLSSRNVSGRSPQMIGPETYLSLKQESYLKEFEALRDGGYTPMPARALPEETYSRNTCIFIFKK